MILDRSRHTLRLGLRSLVAHRLRSSLTVLGIVLGVGSVIVMLAVGEAARYEAVKQLQDLGATTVIVRSVKPVEQDERSRNNDLLAYGLTPNDLERITSTIPTVRRATPLREFRKDLRFQDRKLEGRVVAVTPDYFAQNGLQLSRGRWLTELDDRRFANVVVLGAGVAEVLFPFGDPLGQSIRIGDEQAYRVVGVSESKSPSAGVGGGLGAQDYNKDVYIPFNTDKARFGKLLMTMKAGSYQAEKLEISQITLAVDTIDEVKPTVAVIQGVLEQFHTQKDFSITVPLDLLEKAEQAQRIFTLVLGAIASISLVVGGIGIMNIMLATVTERTKEIGIRRALGAKRRDIALQFLIETVLLSSTGGLLGVGLGIGMARTVTHFFAFPTIIRPWSPLLALGVSLGVGLLFGIYPAQRAARMDPIEALRHE
jgi:putative ABC transport system permease protein